MVPSVDEKSRKYDRQIRIWGHHGQKLLENARVCLLNASATGSEALKNLVLAGISSFTVVDATVVTDRDLGNNFMLQASQLEIPRSEALAACLHELNESARGSCVVEDPADLIARKPSFFQDFTIVIATQLKEADSVKLDEICRLNGVSLVLARTYGLIGTVRVSVPECCILETHPDSVVADTRVHEPWPELLEMADSIDLASLDDMHHAHVPWALLLVKCVAAWKSSHGGALPSTRAEQDEFRKMVRSLERRDEAGPIGEQNVKEAVTHAKLVWAPPRIPPEVLDILNDPQAQRPGPDTSDFWILAAAVRGFVWPDAADGAGVLSEEDAGMLPLEGAIPDMTATTEAYLALQQCYRQKALADMEAVARRCDAILESLGKQPGSIPRSEVQRFCKHCREMRVVRTPPLADELAQKGGEGMRNMLASEGTSTDAAVLLALRACDTFQREHQRYPGAGEMPDLDHDKAACSAAVSASLSDIGAAAPSVMEDIVAEMVRFGATEPHAVAAFVAGIASQEATKLLTEQFVVLSGTLVYNGMACTTTCIPL